MWGRTSRCVGSSSENIEDSFGYIGLYNASYSDIIKGIQIWHRISGYDSGHPDISLSHLHATGGWFELDSNYDADIWIWSKIFGYAGLIWMD